ncbi:mitogen-activated protein kinase kinase kinase 15-like [Rhopalosiphum maidis]|uniref:mitogen-activated protein kinase kinase kinase 15-like n=1 Tax=Rhopalosiphum maidis TaxID=43146 RepID=UPI000EFFFFCC|nr:mitogen-activated protein kinase kinase kinase 15-like [Rhopalosiphum maidis]XP_026813985.1 mitogen-activated protein kinase kinase kinase 15-like [Rhopalosiphum maidis]XP_026813986.1 mitogen-activated protein kinase kinase kinase 15-like [Rhopalosiphum maidis]
MDIVCITNIDDVFQNYNNSLHQKKKALEEVKHAIRMVNCSKLYTFSFELFEELDLEENDELKIFYYADVVIVDLSINIRHSSLFYYLGCRQNIGMNQNIILYENLDDENTLRLKLFCDNSIKFIPYKLAECGLCLICTNSSFLGNDSSSAIESTKSVAVTLEDLLKNFKIQSKVYIKEKFLSDLRTVTKTYSSEMLHKKLLTMKKCLKDPYVLTVDVLYNMMEAFCNVQDYDGVIQLVKDVQIIPDKKHFIQTPLLQYLYCFALNRSNKPEYQLKAMQLIELSLTKNEGLIPDLICLYGRIYKDKFVESIFEDKDALTNAIYWYKKGFEMQPNLHAGVNLATLLLVAGNEFSKSEELQRIGIFLNNLIGKRGSFTSIKDYWTIATYFEINVLTENYGKANKAAEYMFKLKPSIWYYKSTIGNIKLICEFRKKRGTINAEENYFRCWMEYFINATKQEIDNDIHSFPVIVLEPLKVYLPSYIKVNLEVEKKSISLHKQCTKCTTKDCKQMQNWIFLGSAIRSVSFCKIDERCLFLCVNTNYDSFQLYFPSSQYRQRFYDLIKKMIDYDEGITTNLNEDLVKKQINFVYELNDDKTKKVLGRGTYGIVYAALDCNTKKQIAIKEIQEINIDHVWPLHEEINLHSQLYHRNIVQYLGSISEGGIFKIIMEQVPESLSSLLRLKWGPLKKDEPVISFYTKQILEGLKYLHDQKIIHRDIKGDNILINTFSGVAKISDFGISKRLFELCPTTGSFTGTLQFMAPEVINSNSKGYGTAADIWSLGCTVVEMATGKVPFIEFGEAAAYTVGYYKKHPDIPVELSDQAYRFIRRCFTFDHNQRATATDLLKDLFFNKREYN